MPKDDAFIRIMIITTAVAAYPSQVNQSSIQVEFSEDTRDGFFGYSVANLSWESPPGTHITDYLPHAYCLLFILLSQHP